MPHTPHLTDAQLPVHLQRESPLRPTVRIQKLLAALSQTTLQSNPYSTHTPQNNTAPTKTAGGAKGEKKSEANAGSTESDTLSTLLARLVAVCAGDPSVSSDVKMAHASLWSVLSECGLSTHTLTRLRQRILYLAQHAPDPAARRLRFCGSIYAATALTEINGFHAALEDIAADEGADILRTETRTETETPRTHSARTQSTETHTESNTHSAVPLSESAAVVVGREEGQRVCWTVPVECAQAFEWLGFLYHVRVLLDCTEHAFSVPPSAKITAEYLAGILPFRMHSTHSRDTLRMDASVVSARIAAARRTEETLRAALRLEYHQGRARAAERGCELIYNLLRPLLNSTECTCNSGLHTHRAESAAEHGCSTV